MFQKEVFLSFKEAEIIMRNVTFDNLELVKFNDFKNILIRHLLNKHLKLLGGFIQHFK